MTKRIQHGSQLIHQSMRLVHRHKKLIVLPLISNIIIIIMMLFLYTPIARYEKTQLALHHISTSAIVWAYVILLLFLFAVHQVAIYFTAALSHCTKQHFKGKPILIMGGIKAANSHFLQLYNWNSYSGTIGIFLNLFQKVLCKFKFHQRMLQGLSWIIATYLVIPVIMLDKSGPVASIKTSAELVRKTWGQNLRPNFGFLPLLLVARLLSLLPLLIGLAKGGHQNIVIGAGITIILIILVSTVSFTTRAIITCALHIYASEGITVPDFSEKLIKTAFVKRTV